MLPPVPAQLSKGYHHRCRDVARVLLLSSGVLSMKYPDKVMGFMTAKNSDQS